MPQAKAQDSDEDFEESDDGSVGLMSDTDSDDDFQEDLVHRAVLGRPRSKIYDSKDYISDATGMAERSGLDAARLEGTSDNWKAAEGSKRQRRAPAAFEAGAAACFKRVKTSEVAAAAAPTPPPKIPPEAPRGRPEVRHTARSQRKQRYRQRAERRLEAQRQVAASERDLSDEMFLEFSWRQRRSITVSSYAQAIVGESKTEALRIAAIASRASWIAVHNWVTSWRKGEGVPGACGWGQNSKVPSYFQDAEVKLKAAKWWRSRQPKQGVLVGSSSLSHCLFVGDKAPRLSDFVAYLVGTEKNGWVGILSNLLPDAKTKVSVESARRFTISLGFEYQELRKGSFHDKHEDQANQEDRVLRFLPEYDEAWKAGPWQLASPDGTVSDADLFDDVSHRVSQYKLVGGDGKDRIIDFGGVVPLEGPVKLLAGHDECCFKAGEVEKAGWKEKGKQSCVDKTDGPSLHVAGFSCEWGNGCVCTCPESPPPYPISIFELRTWDAAHIAWKNGQGPCPELPITADVWMYPGRKAIFFVRN